MARGQRKLEVVIAGDSRQLERAFGRSAKSSDTFGKKLTRGAGKGLAVVGKAGGLAAVAVGVGFAAAMKHGISGAMDHQKVMAQTNAVLKSTKNAVNTSTKAIEDNATALEAKTGIDGDAIQSGMNLMATFGKVRNELGKGNDMFDRANQTALDMSVTFGTSLQASSIQLGKALQDPIKGVSALTRVGVSFSEQQKDQIKALVDSGKTLEAQKLILAEVNKQVGGSAEAYGKTLPGQIDRSKRAFDALTEAIAGPLLPLVGDIAEGLLGVFQNPQVQTGMTNFSKQISATMQQVVAWFRANWPTIKHVVLTTFEALRTYYQTIVIPVARGIITAVGALVSFIRAHMPQIRAAFQATFAWIEANIVPTVRTIGKVVETVVGAMTTVWRNHGNSIKAVMGPVFDTLKTIVTSALIIIRSIIEATLAVIRGDFAAAGKAYRNAFKAAFDGIVAVLTMYPRIMFELGSIIARKLIDGITTALSNGYNAIKSKVEQMLRDVVKNLSPFSPVEHGGVIIANRLTDGIITGLQKRRAKVSKGLSDVVRQAVQDARGNLGSLTSGLAGMLGTLFGETSAEGKRVREIRAQQKRENDERERVRLQAAINEAETDEERAQARQDLADYELEQEAQRLEDSIAQKQSSYERDIANLTASFNSGAISAQQFRDQLDALIGGQTGADLGAAFAGEFSRQINAIVDQMRELIGFAPGVAGPGVTSPSAVRLEERVAAWEKRRDAYIKSRENFYKRKDSEKGSTITPDERKKLNADVAAWRKNNPRPKALAMGGVLRRAVLAGEAGPEAVLPLSSGRAQRMLAEAMSGADRINGRGGGTTIVNVTVNGNEFSAAEFARKLAPELRRNVALTRST